MNRSPLRAPADENALDAHTSTLLEEVAMDRGLTTTRLSAQLLLVADGAREVTMLGWRGSGSSVTAERLCRCRHDAAVFLQHRGIPVNAWYPTGPYAAATTWTLLQDSGGWIHVTPPAGHPGWLVDAGDRRSFDRAWGEASERATAPSTRRRMAVERRAPSIELVAAVAAGKLIDVHGTVDGTEAGLATVAPTAIRSIDVVPGLAYGFVQLLASTASPDRAVDVRVRGIAVTPPAGLLDPPRRARAYAEAVLETELRRAAARPH